MLLVETSKQHDTNQVAKGVFYNLPVAGRGLRIPCHNITSHVETLGTHLGEEKLVGPLLLI